MHSQLSLTTKPATESEAATTTKLPERIEDHQKLKSKPLPPGLVFIISAVARMAQEPPIWLDPPPPAPVGQLQPGATTKEGRAHEFI
jgi:hypothetical protein